MFLQGQMRNPVTHFAFLQTSALLAGLHSQDSLVSHSGSLRQKCLEFLLPRAMIDNHTFVFKQ